MILASCPAVRPINPQALFHQNACVQSLQVEDYESARTRCELCLEYDENVPECINGLGLVAYARGDNPTAIKYFTQAIQKSRNFAQARNNLGALYFRDGNFQEALTLFRAAVEIDPGYQDARYNYGLCYLRLGQQATGKGDDATARTNYNLAREQYQKLIATSPTYANAYRDLGLIYTNLAKTEKLERDQTADLDQAVTFFTRCLDLEPSNEGCHQTYGYTLLFREQYDDALYHFVQCLAANKKNSECVRGMDDAYQGSQIKSKALGQYIDKLKANPRDAQGHYGFCKALFDAEMNDSAVSECKTAIEINPKLCGVYYDLGMYYKKVLNSNEAFANCREYLLCDTKNVDRSKTAQCEKIVTTVNAP